MAIDKNFNTPTFDEYFIHTAELVNMGINASDFVETVVRITRTNPFKIHATTFTATDTRVEVKMRDADSGRYLQDKKSRIENIAGRPGLGNPPVTLMALNEGDFNPLVWPIPYYLPSAGKLSVEFANLSGAINTVRLAFHGAKVQDGVAPWKAGYRYKVPFNQDISFNAVAPSNTITDTLTMGTDGDYLITGISGIRTGPAMIMITESIRGRDWMDRPVHTDNLIGSGKSHNNLLEKSPRFLVGGSALSITLTNIDIVPNDVFLTFHGIKLYR